MDDDTYQKAVDYIMDNAENLSFMFCAYHVIKPVLSKHLEGKITEYEMNVLAKDLIERIHEEYKEKE